MMAAQTYQVLSTTLVLRTDSEPFFRRFDQDYCHFRANTEVGRGADRVLEVELSVDGPPSLRLGSRTIPLAEHPSPVAWAYHLTIEELFGRFEGFLMIHAGVVARGDRALILVGPSGAGKTTLVLQLLQHGFSFLSDDVCPVQIATGRVHSFRRSAWVAVDGRLPGAPELRRQKAPVKPAALGASTSVRSYRPHLVVCLDAGSTPDNRSWYEIGIKPGAEASFLEALRRVDDEVVFQRLERGFAGLRCGVTRSPGSGAALARLFEQHRQQIWNVYRLDRAAPDFAGPPEATEIPAHEAAFFILGQLKTRPRNAREVAQQLFLQTRACIEGARCYRLKPGRKRQTAELVRGLAEGGS